MKPGYEMQMGDCQNDGPFLGPYYNTGPNLGDPKRDHNFDNPPNNSSMIVMGPHLEPGVTQFWDPTGLSSRSLDFRVLHVSPLRIHSQLEQQP